MIESQDRIRRTALTAFTLIELLVVIAIIALLIAILLPALSGARNEAKRAACLAHLKQIATGMNEYATTENGYIIGAPGGSGSYLLDPATPGEAWGPAVQIWDFMGPMASMWGFPWMTPGIGDQDGLNRRIKTIVNSEPFLCPSNQFNAVQYGGPPGLGTIRMVSYNTCRYVMMKEGVGRQGTETYDNSQEEKLPANWAPLVDRMGSPANKIFCADGARYSTANTPPDYDLARQAGWGGAFSDAGAYKRGSNPSDGTKSWDRSRAPGNGGTGFDARAYGFRHATAEPSTGAPGNAYKGNAAFMDGHAETLGDLAMASPDYWLPTGTMLASSSLWNDARLCLGGSCPPFLRIGN